MGIRCHSFFFHTMSTKIRKNYCEPKFDPLRLIDADLFDECALGCVKYISRNRGDCCDFVCNEVNDITTVNPSYFSDGAPSFRPSFDASWLSSSSSSASTPPSQSLSNNPTLRSFIAPSFYPSVTPSMTLSDAPSNELFLASQSTPPSFSSNQTPSVIGQSNDSLDLSLQLPLSSPFSMNASHNNPSFQPERTSSNNPSIAPSTAAFTNFDLNPSMSTSTTSSSTLNRNPSLGDSNDTSNIPFTFDN